MNRFNGSAPTGNYIVEKWFERDRMMIVLSDAYTGDTILEFWDEDVAEMVEDGFIDPRNIDQSVIDYALHLGLIQ